MCGPGQILVNDIYHFTLFQSALKGKPSSQRASNAASVLSLVIIETKVKKQTVKLPVI